MAKRHATTRKQRFQRMWHEYEVEFGTTISNPNDVAQWAIATGRYREPPSSPLQRCRRELTRAIRDEYITDAKDRDVRLMHPVPRMVGEQIVWEWGKLYGIPPDGMRLSMQRRRNSILADCRQHQIDLDSYNDYNEFGAQLSLFDYNFNLDLEEERLAGESADDEPPSGDQS